MSILSLFLLAGAAFFFAGAGISRKARDYRSVDEGGDGRIQAGEGAGEAGQRAAWLSGSGGTNKA